MSARGTLTSRRADRGTHRLHRPGLGLERLALAAFIITFGLLGYWRPILLDWFSQSWRIGSQYDLVTVYNPQYQTIILYPSDIAAAVTAALWLLARLAAHITGQKQAPLHFGPRYLTLPLIGLAALAALSATQAILPMLSLEMALRLLFLAAFIIAITNLRPPLWAIAAPLALLLAIEGTLSLAQTQAQSTLLSHLLLNWEHNATATQSSASVVQMPNGTRWLRAYGTFPHPNILGGFLCLAMPVVAGAYLRLQRGRWSAWLLLIALGLGMLALLLSFSRAAWLGILIAALWAATLAAITIAAKGLRQPLTKGSPQPQSAKIGAEADGGEGEFASKAPGSACIRRAMRPILLCLLGVGLLAGLVVTLGPAVQSRLLLNNSPLEQRSLSERAILFEASGIFFIRHPWLGVGAGNMPLVELAYPSTRNIGEPAHNVPITIAVETGLFGLLLWLIPPLGALWAAWRRRSVLSAAGLAASAALAALFSIAQLDHYLWSQPTGSLIWWLAVALAALWCERSRAAQGQ